VNDFVVLGRACPERIKDGRVTVCVAGYSQEFGFMRIYPTKIGMPLARWKIARIPLERNPQDNRQESWKIQGSKSEWERLDEKIEVVGEFKKEHRLSLVANLVDGCIATLNNQHRSLGIIKPKIHKHYFSEQDDWDITTQMTLLGKPLPKTKKQYPIVPRVQYCCSNCESKGGHDQQVLEWGFYEWIRNHPEKAEQVWENARIDSPKHTIFFFIGNHFLHRSSFMIISVLRFAKELIQKPIVPWKKG